jgi:exonuclease III
MEFTQNLTLLNSRADLNFLDGYNKVYRDSDLNDDPYFGLSISCDFHNIASLSQLTTDPIFLSINIQSLMSKQLIQFIHDLELVNVKVDVIAVQEIWEIRYPELVTIPGFKPLIYTYKRRKNMRGGGVGFFIRNNLTATVQENLSPFVNKIFESITIQLSYPSSRKSLLLTCAYRSNGQLPNITQTQQMDQFLELFGDLILKLQETNKESYILMDANINLLAIDNPDVRNYLNLLFAACWLPPRDI